jgi:formyltetrahydrofolate-dependent phosphoribosylglycinamide formyltransferase
MQLKSTKKHLNPFFSSLCSMFNKLQQKWNVGPLQLFLILCTFAVTGTSTAWISRSITTWVGFDENTLWVWKLALRLMILIFGYQVIILIVSFFFGQFRFFWNYEKKILKKIGILPKSEANLAIFASGKGSNAEKIIEFFKDHRRIKVTLIVSNKKDAGVLGIALRNKIKTLLIGKENFNHTDTYVQYLKDQGITHIVLAGFLWKVPDNLIQAYPKRIINIHPALLPKYGGKGMYGEHVHQAVISAGEKESGITIHEVDEEYDHGKTIFQAKVKVERNDNPDSLAEKIHVLEHRHYPGVIERWIS